VAPLKALGIDAGTPGNWEVVYGPEVFRKLMSEVNYKVICYNFHEKATGKRLFAPSVLLEKKGVRVAFVGVTDPTTTLRQPPAEVAGLDSTRMGGLREFVQDLKRREKPDLTVLVDHTGLAPSVQLAHDIPEFNIILSGHTHERVYKPILVGKTIVVEPGSMGSFLGRLDVTLRNGEIVNYAYQLLGVDEASFGENPTVKSLIEAAERPFQTRLHEVVGSTKASLMRYDVLETTMDSFVDDAVREATHTDVAFTNGFRFSPPIAAGPITDADLWNILPLDARLKSGQVSGKRMRAYLEHEMELVYAQDPFQLSGGWGVRPSGMTVLFTARATAGNRIKDVKINGKERRRMSRTPLGDVSRRVRPWTEYAGCPVSLALITCLEQCTLRFSPISKPTLRSTRSGKAAFEPQIYRRWCGRSTKCCNRYGIFPAMLAPWRSPGGVNESSHVSREQDNASSRLNGPTGLGVLAPQTKPSGYGFVNLRRAPAGKLGAAVEPG
jgi:S-sulfosulfanyl-L-cysteine sulfohydrolase